MSLRPRGGDNPGLQGAELRAHLAWETAELLGSRFARIPEKHRPYFTPLSASASSLLDKLTHHADVTLIEGHSYRVH